MRYSKDTDAIDAIRTALGDEADNHDVRAIFAEAYEWRTAHNELGQQVDSGWFEQVVSDERFWQIVEAHQK